MQVSRRKISATPLASPGTRLFASEAKATNRPLALIGGRAAGAVGVGAIEAHRHQSGRGRAARRGALTGVAQIDFVQARSRYRTRSADGATSAT